MAKIEIPSDAPAWAKRLASELNKMETDMLDVVIREKLEGLLKDVPKIFWHRRVMPTSPDNIKDFVDEVKSDFAEYSKVVHKSNPVATQQELDAVLEQLPFMGESKKQNAKKEEDKSDHDKMLDSINSIIRHF